MALATSVAAPVDGGPASTATALNEKGAALLVALKAAAAAGLPPTAALLRAMTKYTSLPGATNALTAAASADPNVPPPAWARKLAAYAEARSVR